MSKLNRKVLKYGSASIVLAVVFIALVFALNLIVGIVTEKFNLYIDLTPEQLYNISDTSFELLSDMDDEVRIVFLTPLDQLDTNNYIKNIKTLALEYEEQFDNITVEYVDMHRDTEFRRKYYKEGISDTTIVVESGDKYAKFDMNECFVYTQNENGSYNYYAFNGEYRFTSSLLKVTRDTMPRVAFTTNHSEEIPSAFRAMFEDSGFEVLELDIMQEDIPSDIEILIMNAPLTDITGVESEEEGKSEVTKLTAYLAQGGDMMIFVDPNTPVLKNLSELMYTWGIDVLEGLCVHDNEKYFTAANDMAVYASYISKDENVVPLHEKLSSKNDATKIVSYYTAPVSTVPVTDVNRGSSPVIASSTTAYVPKSVDENYIENREIPLIVAGYNRRFNSETGNTDVNYLVAGGSTYFVSDQFLHGYAATFANAELIRTMISAMTDEKMVLDVPFKVYKDTSLIMDSATEQQNMLASLVLVLPAIVLAAAVGVFLKRRHL